MKHIPSGLTLLIINCRRSAIIIVQYEKEKGTFGLVVNRRVPLKVADLLDTASALQGVGMSNTVREGLTAFEDNSVYRGGDVAMHFLSILHPFGDLPHAQRLADGVYWQCDLQVLYRWSAWQKKGKARSTWIWAGNEWSRTHGS